MHKTQEGKPSDIVVETINAVEAMESLVDEASRWRGGNLAQTKDDAQVLQREVRQVSDKTKQQTPHAEKRKQLKWEAYEGVF